MLSNRENTLNKLKPGFIGFSLPISRDYFAGEIKITKTVLS